MSRKLHISIIFVLCSSLALLLPLKMGMHIASADGQNVSSISVVAEGSLVVPGEILVKFKHGIPEKAIEAINKQHSASVIDVSPLGFMRLSIPKGRSVEQMVQTYSMNPNVEYAEPNAICRAVMTPNDPFYSFQWHLDNDEYGGINIEDAWDISTGEGVVVAVLDTGVAYEDYDADNDGSLDYKLLDDLEETTFVEGWDFVNLDSHPNDDHWHGTHVTGTIAQSTNNSFGAAGVAFGASIMPIKVLNASGSGSASQLVNGILYAANHGAKVINMSLAFPWYYAILFPNQLESVHSAIQYAYNQGVTIVAAAGNDGANSVAYPAAFEECIAVGATQYNEMLAPYSNWGVELDLTAPGGNLDLNQNGDTLKDGVLQRTIDPWNGPLYFSTILAEGTSMASPHVAGVAALVIALGVTGPDNVRQVLQSTGEDHGGGGWDVVYGWGIVDAYAAVVEAMGGVCTDSDGDSYSTCDGDCDDGDNTVWQLLTGYVDNDDDGYGTGSALQVCSGATLPSGYAANADDCDDFDENVNPAATEACDGIDNNCDGNIDEGLTCQTMMHVGDLDGSSIIKKRNWQAHVTVTIHDNLHNNVAGATVYGQWSNKKKPVSGITGSDGTVTFTINVRNNASVDFTVTNVTHTTFTYDSTVNHDPDGDSDGITTTIIK